MKEPKTEPAGKTFFIIEDHSLMRQGITDWLCENSGWRVLGQAENGLEALEKLKGLSENGIELVNLDGEFVADGNGVSNLDRQFGAGGLPFLVIVDVNLGDDDGIALAKQIHSLYPAIKILMYTMHKSPALIRIAMDSGASGYISKDCDEKELLSAMEVIYSGQKFVEPSLMANCFEWQSVLDVLTRREREVLALVSLGMDNARIAEKLNLEKRVVENYVSRLYSKTGAKNRAELGEVSSRFSDS